MLTIWSGDGLTDPGRLDREVRSGIVYLQPFIGQRHGLPKPGTMSSIGALMLIADLIRRRYDRGAKPIDQPTP
jgi:hypothetical protein